MSCLDPGVRCDVPANVYQSTFSPNTQWSEEFAQGAEIRQYWQNLAKKHSVYDYTKFNTQVTKAEWNDQDSHWVLSKLDLVSNLTSTESFDFLITAIGLFNSWRFPDYPGLETFEGHLRHSSNWDPDFDPKGKHIAVIGNGASGIQLVPELQKTASHIDHYARSRTWIAGSIGGRDRAAEPMYFSQAKLDEFANDPAAYLAYRKELEGTYWRRFGDIIKSSTANASARAQFTDLMRARLGDDNAHLLEQIVPDFSPHCRRLTPGPGYLEALTKPNVTYITTPISHITSTGIVTTDGTLRPVDAIICSTGAKVDFAPSFPIVAAGIDLAQAWQPDGAFGFPYTYLGVATPGFPNLGFIHGPNASGWSGTVPHNDENQITYLARLLRKISTQGIRTAMPSRAAADDFVEYADKFFPRTVLTEECSSWANGRRPGGRIHGLWPGSAAHVTHARRSPRWEDWEWTHVNTKGGSEKGRGNRFAYFGNGWTSKEGDEGADVTPYLKLPEQIDLRDVHESWWDL